MLVNHNYVMHCSVITVLMISYAEQRDYSTNTLSMQLQCRLVSCALTDHNLLSILLLLRISNPYLVQAGRRTIVANHKFARMVVTAILIKHFCPAVISN